MRPKVELLENHTHTGPDSSQVLIVDTQLAGHWKNLIIMYKYAAIGRLLQQVQAAKKCAFSRTAWTNNTNDLSLHDIQIDSL
jgi:hypothetical protein